MRNSGLHPGMFGGLNSLNYTHHPLKTRETAHLSGSVNGSHSILSSHVQRTACIGYQVFKHLQMTLLGGQVNWCHVVFHLHISTIKQTNGLLNKSEQIVHDKKQVVKSGKTHRTHGNKKKGGHVHDKLGLVA